MGLGATFRKLVLTCTFWGIAASLLAPTTLPGGYVEVTDLAQEPILTPSFARRKTAKLRLNNGLEVYVISDPAAEQSAATLCVDVGSWDDPDEFPGMAHFVEHMLFLGTKEYPDEGAFDRFVQQHGGQGNAGTSADRTCYTFSIDTEAFKEGLHRFASFFREPLFNPSGVERELMAIDQEFARLTRDDDALRYFIFQALSNPDHPNSRFTVGNAETLAKVPSKELISWYKEHYSANLMHLVVYSSENLDSLKTWVDQDFSGVPNTNKQALEVTTPIFTPEFRGKVSMNESLKDTRELVLYWELPGKFAKMRDSKPGDIVSHILGHEGDRSLLSWLKEGKLAEGLVASANEMGNDNYVLTVKITLTRKGLKNIDEVIERSFQAIQKLRRRGVPEYVFHDIQRMTRLNYAYQQRQPAFTLVSGLGRLIGDERLETFPEQTFILQKYNPEAIAEIIREIAPERAHIHITAPAAILDASLDKYEPWTGTAYTVQPLPKEKIARWKDLQGTSEFDVPPPNSLIPREAKVLAAKKGHLNKRPDPRVIVDDAYGKVFYAQDEYYQVPEVFIGLEVLTPEIHRNDAKAAVMADLYVKALEETLNELTYTAKVAGLDFNIAAAENGLSIQIQGYSDNAHTLLEEVLSHIKAVKPNASRFGLYKESLSRQYRNFNKEAPYLQALEVASSLLYRDYVTHREKARVVKKISFKGFGDYKKHLFDQTYVKGLVYGNVTEGQAKRMWKTVRDALAGRPYPESEHQEKAIADLSQQEAPSYIVQSSKTTGNAAILMTQAEPFSFESRAVQQILAQGLKAPFFNTLRTKQQTGYAVQTWAEELERKLFLLFAVESDTHDGRDLIARFELFLEDFRRELGDTELTEPEFQAIRDALVTRLVTPPENLEQQGAVLMELATNYDGDFKWMEKRADAMRNLPYKTFYEQADKILSHKNKKRMAVILRGNDRSDGYLRYQRAKNSRELRSNIRYDVRDDSDASLAQKVPKR